MASAGSIKSLSEDTFVSKACADTLADAPTDVLIERDDNDNVGIDSNSDFEPEIVRKIKKIVHLLSVD
jgi:hypothetical protein